MRMGSLIERYRVHLRDCMGLWWSSYDPELVDLGHKPPTL